MTWTWRGNLKREIKCLLTAAQNDTIRTNYTKAKIDNTKEDSKSSLWDNRREIVYNISKYSKLALKEYKSMQNNGKLIHRELCKGLKFGHIDKWYI